MTTGRYGKDSDPVDYILGITFEIWEEGNVNLIDRYYARDVTVYALDGVSHGPAEMIAGTRAYLDAYPDRLLLAENVVWSREPGGFYSSHRIRSPMTNLGKTIYGPATEKKVCVRAVADCLINDGQIVREWLVRDALPLVNQLGFDPVAGAEKLAARIPDATRAWMESEVARVRRGGGATSGKWRAFAARALESAWITGEHLGETYPHYALLHRSPIEMHSGLPAIEQYFQDLRSAFSETSIAVDHIAAQPFGETGTDLAVRWALAAKHSGNFKGMKATRRDVFILGVSHWRLVENRIAIEWQMFDAMAVMAQLV